MRSVAQAAPIVGVAGLTLVVLGRPDLWMVEHVEFRGIARSGEAELRHLADLPNGTAMWNVYPDRVARAVARHPWVRSARVQLVWPDRVVIDVDEHDIAALLRHGDGVFAVDAQGQVFLRAGADLLDQPSLTGIPLGDEAGHPDVGPRAVRAGLALIDALDARDIVSRSEMSEVAFSPSAGFTAYTLTGAELVFRHGAVGDQLDRLDGLVGLGLDLTRPIHVDLAPATVAIVRPLSLPAGVPPRTPSLPSSARRTP